MPDDSKPPAQKRNAHGQFIEPNPLAKGGRPGGVAGMARAIRARDDDGRGESRLFKWLWEVWEGTVPEFPKPEHRIWAWERLTNRGYGREVDVTVLANVVGSDVANPAANISTDQLRALLLQRLTPGATSILVGATDPAAPRHEPEVVDAEYTATHEPTAPSSSDIVPDIE